MTEVSKTAQLLHFFAKEHGREGVPRKRLIKLAYMADILARQYLGHPISGFEYVKDHFGPNARELPDYTAELDTLDLAKEVSAPTGGGKYSTICLRSVNRPTDYAFSLGENEILGYVMVNYADMDLDEFIREVVKKTDPFLTATQHLEKLEMEVVDNTGRDAVGFDLEKVLHAETQFSEGQYSTLADFSRDIRDHLTH
jgi:antitoxin SocA-like protein